MSFLQKLMSYRPYRTQVGKGQQQQQQQQQQACQEPGSQIYTRDEGDFVNVFPVASEGDEESADVSRWEMAEILSHRNKTVVSKKSGPVTDERWTRLRRQREQQPPSKATTVEDTRSCMEDSKELEKYDDKRSRILKGSRRRRYVSFDVAQ